MPVLADDNVVVHRDAERLGDVDDRLGHVDKAYFAPRASALQQFQDGLIESSILQLTPSGANTRSTLLPSS
jgi:rRNA processing protein Gar1